MKKLFLILLGVGALSVLAESTNLLTIDFEAPTYSEGEVAGQDGWVSIYGGVASIVNDAVQAGEGEQFFDGTNNANHYKNFDISSEVETGQKLKLGCLFRLGTGSNGNFKFQNRGTSGKNWGVEFIDLVFSPGGSVWFYGGDTAGGGKTWYTNGYSSGVWHQFYMVIDPATRTIEAISIDDNVYDPETQGTMKYKPSGMEAGCGDLPDSVRFNGVGAIDNITIEAVPEPAVFALLALIGLFAARKN